MEEDRTAVPSGMKPEPLGENAVLQPSSSSFHCLCLTAGGKPSSLLGHNGASLVAQMVKNLPAMQETWVLSLGWEDPLEKEKATHSSILAWEIPRIEESGRLQSTGSKKVRHD